jgi:hypothetical protein
VIIIVAEVSTPAAVMAIPNAHIQVYREAFIAFVLPLV